MPDRDRDRGKITTADGQVLATIEPPPYVVVLVEKRSADNTWKTWLQNLFNAVLGINYVAQSFTAPNMTTTERNAMTAVNGMIIYNTTTLQFEFYENGAWVTK